ncbi:Eco57I restriction-modification methylase domain-containing protein [Candidatus Zixiibacteriota bacterium]
MNKQQAQEIIRITFEHSFIKSGFTQFIKNLLNKIYEESFTYQGNYIPEAYRQYIKTLERIGKFCNGEHTLDVLIITLQKETSLERARTMQRNFIAWYLNGSRGGEMKDAALVAYVSPDQNDWRFSLVKMDYKFEKTKTGKMKVREEFTPARRWSFLVGANEKSHTAQSQLVKILADDEHDPTLAELEEAFNIETVTKEFFLKYRELFIRTKEALDKVVKNDPNVKADFEAKGVDTVNFSKKLLGQIVFLYFLQKKGWFGVSRDDNWGTGSKQFLRELFEGKHGSYKNFFNDILEPLFYEALRIDRSHDDDYYSRFNCKIPFLNGGLFDPIGNYDWVHTDINLPNELFSNTRKTKEGDIGDGILDIFDRYNFTVREDEPLEKEVAIDPELLGKAYEKFNAIRPDNFDEFTKALKSGKKGEENKFNKKFGVYYTPREIVHYMCKQSLINYIFTRAEEAKLDTPITKQDIEDLIEVGELITEYEAAALIKEQNIKNGIQKSTEYTSLLSDGIRKNARIIDDWLADITVCDPAMGSGAFPVGMMNEIMRARNVLSVFLKEDERSDYEFKRRCIEHSIYGVDIDPGAVEIAKLRLWLSLMVDEEDIRQIKPLPNLDYKIVCGNSLLAYPYTPRGLEKVEQLKDQFINETRPSEKKKLRTQINESIYSLFKNTEKILGYKVTVDYKINFSEVFRRKGGFDVVIANPPYGVSIKGRYRIAVSKNLGKVPDYEIYYYFLELSQKLLNSDGVQCYIIPNTFLFNIFAATYRKQLLEEWDILLILDCTEFKLFEATTVHNAITLFSKANRTKEIGYKNTLEARSFDELSKRPTETISNDKLVLNNTNWALSFRLSSNILNLVSKIKSSNIRLIEIFPDISQGLIAYDKYKGQSEEIIKTRAFHFKNKIKDDLKPWLNGEDIRPYLVKWNGKEYIDYCDGIANPREPRFFKGRRLLVREITNPKIYAGYTEHEQYHDPAIIVVLNNEKNEILLLLGILNSKFATFYHFNASPKATKGAFPKILVKDIQDFPLPEWENNKPDLEDLVKTIHSITKDDDYLQSPQKLAKVKALEREIDQIVYQLYGLTEEEIRIVEGEGK